MFKCLNMSDCQNCLINCRHSEEKRSQLNQTKFSKTFQGKFNILRESLGYKIYKNKTFLVVLAFWQLIIIFMGNCQNTWWPLLLGIDHPHRHRSSSQLIYNHFTEIRPLMWWWGNWDLYTTPCLLNIKVIMSNYSLDIKCENKKILQLIMNWGFNVKCGCKGMLRPVRGRGPV